MAKACAIRAIQDIGGRKYIAFTYGDPPLGAVATTEMDYANEASLMRAISEIELRIGEEGLMLLHLATTWLQPNGTLGNVNQVLNKTITLDPFAPQPLKIT